MPLSGPQMWPIDLCLTPTNVARCALCCWTLHFYEIAFTVRKGVQNALFSRLKALTERLPLVPSHHPPFWRRGNKRKFCYAKYLKQNELVFRTPTPIRLLGYHGHLVIPRRTLRGSLGDPCSRTTLLKESSCDIWRSLDCFFERPRQEFHRWRVALFLFPGRSLSSLPMSKGDRWMTLCTNIDGLQVISDWVELRWKAFKPSTLQAFFFPELRTFKIILAHMFRLALPCQKQQSESWEIWLSFRVR